MSDGDGDAHWKFTWPCAQFLAEFIYSNEKYFHGSRIVELGAGVNGVPGITAAAAGASFVIFTENSENQQALDMLEQNVSRNLDQMEDVETQYKIEGLDWMTAENPRNGEPGDVADFLACNDECDYIIASDVFYEPALFAPLVQTIALFIEKWPNVRFYFAYHLRDENHTIAPFLEVLKLSCVLVRTVHRDSTLQIGLIYKEGPPESKMYAGVEGGGTCSHLVFLDKDGKTVAESRTKGTNLCLLGIQETADTIAKWVREQAKVNNILLPLEALGMGLSGAEDDHLNKQFIDYLNTFHGDLAKNFSVDSDGICVIQAAFEREGVVMITGTGSTTRLLKADGTRHGVGGWGHMIGDGGSGFWISRKAIQVLFDDDDGLETACGDTTVLRQTILEHFALKDKTNILPMLYSDFEKSKIATLCKALSEQAEDPVIARVFYDGGYILGRQLVALSKHMDESMLENVPVVTIGSVFNSWRLLNRGFLDALKSSNIKKVSFCRSGECPAVGGAVLAARQANLNLPLNEKSQVYEDHAV